MESTMGISGLKDKVLGARNGVRDHFPTHGQGGDQVRGGTEEEITHNVNHEEVPSDDDSDESDENQAKSLSEFVNDKDPPEVRRRYGDLPLTQSQEEKDEGGDPAKWTPLPFVSSKPLGELVVFRGRVHIVRRMSARLVFIVFREQLTTIQGVVQHREGEISESMIRWAAHIRPGSIVVVKGKLQKPEQKVKTASIHAVEIGVEEIHVVTQRTYTIPFSVYEAEAATDGRSISDRVRLSNRILDLRTPTSQAIFRIQSAVCNLFRSFLDSHGFLEIHTPKLQGGSTEGGSSVFKLEYFGRPAFLAQSPQLAKQMCIAADFGKVYEIGPVFRAENSNTSRHMTEYTGLDLEMAINGHYHEAMWLIDAVLKHIFKGIYENHRHEIQTLKHHFPHEDLVWHEQTTVITFSEGVKMLNESGWQNDDGSQQSEYSDLPTKGEKRLGELVKEKFHTDYYILDKFPTSARPFYTMLDPKNPKLTNSFDFMVRGQEILSGGQRIHGVDMLLKRLDESDIDPSSMREYIEGFQWVAPPHAGAGIGLERLVSLILELGNIRYATLFPRDPRSFPGDPSAVDLRYPEDSTLRRPKGHLQPLGNLIANYGDSTNTSWFDKRFQIWRDDNTGAAVAYVPIHKRAILPGNPLCAPQQLGDVIQAFLRWLKRETRLKPIFVLVDKAVEEVLGEKFGWKSFTNAAEQRVNLANNDHINLNSEVERKIRHARKEGVKVVNYGSDLPEDVRQRCDENIKKWQESRKGEQMHLSEVSPWTDNAHRQYLVAEDGEKNVHALVVLSRLAPRYGEQVKWALDFPGATNGAIEFAVQTALKAAAEDGNKCCTFGAGATADLSSGHHLAGVKATTLNSIYQAYAARFHLDQKTGFRAKFNIFEDRIYICYPPKGLGQKGMRAIVDFFQD